MLLSTLDTQEIVNEIDDKLIAPSKQITITINANLEDLVIGLLHDTSPNGLYIKLDTSSTKMIIKKSAKIVTRNSGFSIFIAEQSQPF